VTHATYLQVTMRVPLACDFEAGRDRCPVSGLHLQPSQVQAARRPARPVAGWAHSSHVLRQSIHAVPHDAHWRTTATLTATTTTMRAKPEPFHKERQ
jgi:hypothetical protein